MGMLHGTRRALLGAKRKHLLKFDASLTTFTPSMAVRAGTVFAGAPIVQGQFDGTDGSDNLNFARGNLVGNAAALFYDRFDPNQGTIVVTGWIPETDRTAGRTRDEYLWRISTEYYLRYEHDNQRLLVVLGGQASTIPALDTVAGDFYCVIVSWDCKKPIDGTNYIRMSLNDAHTYGAATQPTASAPGATMNVGSSGLILPANALLEGLFDFRRVFFDGTYGTDVNGGIDEIALISAGADPCAIAGGGGSWDCVFGLPTDSTPAALVTGTGHAWSHPHDSEIELDPFLDDAYAGGNWVNEGTPLTPKEITFDGAATSVVVADAAEIQDLHAGEFTAEAWISPDDWGGGGTGRIFDKTDRGSEGWFFFATEATGLEAVMYCVTTAARSRSGSDEFLANSQWCHVAMQFDGTALPAGNPPIYLWVNGIPVVSYTTQTPGVGAAKTDVGNDLYLGNRDGGDRAFDGRLGGWSRLSNNLRYTPGEAFVPDARMNPPNPADGNTVWQTDYSDGAGAVLTDDSGGGNNGAITDGAGGWLVTHSMALDAPGERVYHAGYVFGADAVDEGFKQTVACDAGQDFVFRVPVHWGADSRGQPKLVLWDETNDAEIKTFLGPKMLATHDGGDDSATLIDADGGFRQSMVGMTLYNITDGSLTVVTAVSGDGTTATGVLAGGTDNNWDDGDVARFVWSDGFSTHPWCETYCAEAPTIARNGVGADCISVSWLGLNASDEGTLYWHQVEWLANLIDNPSLETFQGGNPDIPDGWTNFGLGAGDSSQGAVVHSGAASFQLNNGAGVDGAVCPVTAAIGSFIGAGFWGIRGGGAGTINFVEGGGNDWTKQTTLSGQHVVGQIGVDVWQTRNNVMRIIGNVNLLAQAQAINPTVALYADDFYAIILNAVSLTATPRSEANSLELGGLSIDGRDTCTQPTGRLTRTHGEIRFSANPRHDMNEVGAWGQVREYLLYLNIDGNNRFYIARLPIPRIEILVESNGVSPTDIWNTAWSAGEKWDFIVKWTPAKFWILVNGVEQLTVNWASPFTTAPSAGSFEWGAANGANQFDGVILP